LGNRLGPLALEVNVDEHGGLLHDLPQQLVLVVAKTFPEVVQLSFEILMSEENVKSHANGKAEEWKKTMDKGK
jgi:hypothetical protein